MSNPTHTGKRPVYYPRERGVVACPLPVTRLATCHAYRGRGRCGREFVQQAMTEQGQYTLFTQHQDVEWTPKFCVRCERSLLALEGRRAAYAGRVDALRNPTTQGHPQ
jgi:hypothetical protein